MDNSPLISLIIPIYNAAHTLERCLSSVVGQTYNNLEIIVVDDGSTDEGAVIYEEFSSTDGRIKILRQTNSGVSKARNSGVESATGSYICFVDSDDWVEPNYCEKLFSLIQNEGADIAIVEAAYEDEAGNVVFQKPVADESVFDGRRALLLLLEDEVIQSHPWGKLYRADLVRDIKFPEDLKCFEDYSTLFKIFNKAVKVAKSNDQLYHYIQHSASLSHNLSPETAYQFYLAIMKVYSFWRFTMPLEEKSPVTKNIIRKLLMVLKRILRNTDRNVMQVEKEIIRKSFRSFLQYPITDIGLEYYFYVRMYYFFPAIYTKLISKK